MFGEPTGEFYLTIQLLRTISMIFPHWNIMSNYYPTKMLSNPDLPFSRSLFTNERSHLCVAAPVGALHGPETRSQGAAGAAGV